MRILLVIAVGACAHDSGAPASQPDLARAEPAKPAAAEPPPPPAAAPTQVALGGEARATGDPCEGGEAVPTSGNAGGGVGVQGLGVGDPGRGDGAGGLRGAPARSHEKARVAPGTPNIAPDALPPEVIRRIVRMHLPEIRYCYDMQLMVNPSVAGLLKVSFAIHADGTVTVAKVTAPDDALGTCVGDAFKKIEFPKPKDGATVQVTYPFNLSP
jgi:hypothetical protein